MALLDSPLGVLQSAVAIDLIFAGPIDGDLSWR